MKSFEKHIADLAFELGDSTNSKFLFGVSNDSEQRKELQAEIAARLKAADKSLELTKASQLRGNFVSRLADRIHEKRIDCFIIESIPELSEKSARTLFGKLNFRRDALSRLSVPMLMWLTSEQIHLFTTVAPDFWSRRTAVYDFTSITAQEAILRLFSDSPIPRESFAKENEIPNAFEAIFNSEKTLRECCSKRDQFSLIKSHELTRSIREGVTTLSRSAKQGHQIEISFALWNMSRLDDILQRFLSELGPFEKSTFESLYTDRTEVLLYMAEQLEKVFTSYTSQWKRDQRRQKFNSLVDVYATKAVRRLNQIATELKKLSELSAYDVSEIVGEVRFPPDDTKAWASTMFRERAAEELELWLSGRSGKRPSPFTPREGEVLKAMYANSSAPLDLAQKFGVSDVAILAELDRLERKVRLYLSIPRR